MSIQDRITKGFYNNKKEYPRRPLKSLFVFPHPTHPSFDQRGYEKALENYAVLIQEYDNETYDLEQQFKQDALAELGLTDHPKANKLYEYAWDGGHSSGYNSVFNIMQDLAALLD